MRILIPANALDAVGGLERTQLTNCTGLARRGHHLDLVFVRGGEFEQAWSSVAESMTRVTTTLPRRAHPLRTSHELWRTTTRLRSLDPDAVYVYRYWDLPLAVAVARGRRTAVVYHLCLPPPDPLPRWMRTVLARVDATVSVSRHTLGLWEGTGLDTTRAQIALTSVDLAHYAPADDAERALRRAELGIGPGEFVVLFAGRVTPDKGVDVLVEAFRHVVTSLPEARLVVVGLQPTGPAQTVPDAYEARLLEAADGLPVTWVHRRSDVVPLLHAADVAAVPSRWPEPLSRSILEPLACGVPVVASRVGGSPEVLTGWLSEFLVPPEDPEALAGRLVSLHAWRRRDPGLGDRCRGAAEARLSLDGELDVIERAMADAVGAEKR